VGKRQLTRPTDKTERKVRSKFKEFFE